jgi:hypothetical protein
VALVLNPQRPGAEGHRGHHSIAVGVESSSLPTFDLTRSAAIAARRFGNLVLRVAGDLGSRRPSSCQVVSPRFYLLGPRA